MAEQANKHDDNKLPMHLIPPEAMVGLAEVLAFGARKYSDRNWEKGMEWSRVFSALQRHAWQYFSRCALDKETRLSHLKSVLACTVFLLTYEERGVGIDDRPRDVAGHIWDTMPSLTDLWKQLETKEL